MQFIDFYNNPNIGLFFYTTNKITIVPTITPDKLVELIKAELKTKVVMTDVYCTNVDNIFLTGNEEYLFAPTIISPDEKKCLETSGLKLVLIETTLNALGNNMVFHGNNAIINPHFEKKVVEQLEKLGFNVTKTTIAGIETVGANIVIMGDKALVNPDIKKDEIELVEKGLNLKLDFGTVNNGSKLVKSGLVVNKKGALVSSIMTGAEIMRIEEMLA
ncbi:Translation initiation factor 6 [Candidatus Tiddalikarchaeum anstoanum]|nr:Translation initiation factor 6 [Candidatus Tiddalikarchaeum anstoanum]